MEVKDILTPQTIDEWLEMFGDAYRYLTMVEHGMELDGNAQALKNKLFRSHLIPFINSEGRKCVRNLMNYKTYDLETLKEVKEYINGENINPYEEYLKAMK